MCCLWFCFNSREFSIFKNFIKKQNLVDFDFGNPNNGNLFSISKWGHSSFILWITESCITSTVHFHKYQFSCFGVNHKHFFHYPFHQLSKTKRCHCRNLDSKSSQCPIPNQWKSQHDSQNYYHIKYCCHLFCVMLFFWIVFLVQVFTSDSNHYPSMFFAHLNCVHPIFRNCQG